MKGWKGKEGDIKEAASYLYSSSLARLPEQTNHKEGQDGGGRANQHSFRYRNTTGEEKNKQMDVTDITLSLSFPLFKPSRQANVIEYAIDR